MNNMLTRAVAWPFYRQHAGAFLFLFLLLFGIQPSIYDALQFHYSVIQSILGSGLFLLSGLVAWVFYTFKTVHFIYHCLHKKSYDFILCINAINPAPRFICLLRLNSLLQAPIIIYGLIILLVSVKEKMAIRGILIFLAILFLCVISAIIALLLVQKGKSFQQVVRNRFAEIPIPVSLSVFTLKYMFRKQLVPLLLVKLLSFFSLYYFTRTDPSVFENRMLWLIFITSLSGHSLLVYRNFFFIENEIGFYRNMPVKNLFTLLQLVIVYGILLLPEAWALRALITDQQNAVEYGWMILTGPFFLLLLHSLLYTEDMRMEEFLKLLFGVWIVFILLSLLLNHWLMPVIALLCGILIFNLSYRNYEKKTAIPSGS